MSDNRLRGGLRMAASIRGWCCAGLLQLPVVKSPMSVKRLLMIPSLCLVLSGVTYAGGEYVGERNSFNRFHGHGVYTYTNGVVFDGQWVDGRKQGEGKQTQGDGSVYTGQWMDNLQTGKGNMRWTNGDQYEGDWSAGRMHGRGVFVRKNGERFEGSWNQGKRQGSGVLNKPDVGVIAGQWDNDQLSGIATVTFANGDKFTGGVKNDMPQGKGICKTKTASAACEYKDGKLLAADLKPDVKPILKPGMPMVAKVPVMSKPPALLGANTVATTRIDERAGGATTAKLPGIVGAINAEPTAAGIAPTSVALKTDAPQFSFLHDWNGSTTKNNTLPKVFAEKDAFSFGDVKIRAEGGDLSLTLVIDEYMGPGVYPLKYFKASIAKEGIASYQTAAAEPGELRVTYDDGKLIKGTFRFVAYRNGNPATQEKKSVSDGLFVVPVRSAGNAATP